MHETLIQAHALTKRFDANEVVRGIDFTIPRGSCFGFLGPNGAGKTTTIRMLLGLSPITSGSLELFGLPMPAAGRAIRARVGVVPQMDNLDPDFTVAENLRIYASYFGIRGRALDRRIDELLDFVELRERAPMAVSKLSGGMLRRLTIARALINDPELVILDEPTTGLDPQVRHLIWGRLRELQRRGKTLLLTTHYMEEAERLCDELVIMDKGRILEQGSPAGLIREHIEAEVVEIRGTSVEAYGTTLADTGCRIEPLGDLLYCYADNARPLIDRLEADGCTHPYLHRRANMEDVFLKLTGRELHE